MFSASLLLSLAERLALCPASLPGPQDPALWLFASGWSARFCPQWQGCALGLFSQQLGHVLSKWMLGSGQVPDGNSQPQGGGVQRASSFFWGQT